jgi:serine protease Do
MPDYATMHGDRGCRIQAVPPASPAADAGLQAGDTIIQWNDRTIGNVHDLQEALNDSAPGQIVKLRLRRDGKTITLAVTLGSK